MADIIKDQRHTYLFDLDGTLIVHTEVLSPDFTFLPGAVENLSELILNDAFLILLTGRSNQDAQPILDALWNTHGIKFEHCLFGLPVGPRTIINDTSAAGECKAFAISHTRNAGWAQ